MTFGRQVLHLLRRELRGLVPWMVLMGLVLAVAFARGTEVARLGTDTLPTSIAILVCVALASAVRALADSPTRDDAFWATQPIDARALVVAKLLAGLCLIALCGTALVMLWHDWGYPLTSALTVALTTLGGMTVWSLGAAVVASVCTHRALAWLAVGSLVLITQIFGESVMSPDHLERSWVTLATCMSLALGGITLIGIYQRRPERLVHRAGVIVVGGLLLLASTVRPSSRSERAPSHVAGSDSVTMRLALAGQPECDGQSLILPLDVMSPSWARVELTRPRTTLVLTNGDSVALANSEWMQSVGLWGSLLPPALFPRTLDDDAANTARRVRRADIAFVVPAAQRERVCGRVARVHLRVQLRSATGVELLRVPLVAGRTAAAPGVRVRVRDAGQRDSLRNITAQLSSLVSMHGQHEVDIEDIDFALRHPRSGAVARLAYKDEDGLTRAADLPGLSRVSRTLRLGVDRPSKQLLTALDTSEFTQLVVVAPRWRPRAERSVTADVPPSLAVTLDRSAVRR